MTILLVILLTAAECLVIAKLVKECRELEKDPGNPFLFPDAAPGEVEQH